MPSYRTYPGLLSLGFSFFLLANVAFSNPWLTKPWSVEQLNNILDTVPVNDSIIEGKIYEAVEEEAYFPGKEEGWLAYLQQNLNPDVPIRNGAPAGRYTVYIQF